MSNLVRVFPTLTPPSADRAEMAFLGHCLMGDLPHGFYGMRPDVFADPVHSRIFSTIQQLADHGVPVTLLGLTREFCDDGRLDEVGGTAYLAQLVTAVTPGKTAVACAALIIDAWQRRGIIDAQEVIRECGDEAAFQAFDDASGISGQRQINGVLGWLQEVVDDLKAAAAVEVVR